MQKAIVLKYDYSPLQQALEIKNHTLAIKVSMQQTVEEIISIGEHLTAVKKLLPHGEFGEWLKVEFGMSHMTATRYMNVYNRFGKINTVLILESEQKETVLNLPSSPKVAYELAAHSFPEETRERLKEGEAVKVDGEPKTINQLTVADIKRLKPPKTKQPSLAQPLIVESVESEPKDLASLKKQLRQLQVENALLKEKLESTVKEKTDVLAEGLESMAPRLASGVA